MSRPTETAADFRQTRRSVISTRITVGLASDRRTLVAANVLINLSARVYSRSHTVRNVFEMLPFWWFGVRENRERDTNSDVGGVFIARISTAH